MSIRPHVATHTFARLGGAALVLTAFLLPWAQLSAPSALAQTRFQNPVARLQVAVNYVDVFDDGDWWGKGEFTLYANVQRYQSCTDGAAGSAATCSGSRGTVSEQFQFSASSGTFAQIDRVLPDASSNNQDPYATPGAGIAVYAGESVAVAFSANEHDPFDFPHGSLLQPDLVARESNGWAPGTHSKRFRQSGFDITVYYEVRLTPLPDLVPHNLRPFTLDDGRPMMCASALNRGERPSSAFELTLLVDSSLPTWGVFQAPALAVNELTEHCFLLQGLAPGSHRFAIGIDPQRRVVEMNETNNTSAEQTFTIGAASTGQSPATARAAGGAAERLTTATPVPAARSTAR